MKAELIRTLIGQAEQAVASVKDPEIKKVAFQTVLQHLLGGTRGNREGSEAPRKPGPTETKRTERSGKKKAGLMDRLGELVSDGFFEKPKAVPDVVKALAERACHVRGSDLTWQMAALVDKRTLRRKKEATGKGGRKVWAYSNW